MLTGGAVLVWAALLCAQPRDTAAGPSLAALLEAKARRPPGYRKLSSQLLDAVPPPAAALRQRTPPAGVQDMVVTVDVRADVTPAVLACIQALGGTGLHSVPQYRAIRARLPRTALEPLARLEAVQFIRPADQAITR